MTPKYLIITDEEFGKDINICRSDLYDSPGEADWAAEQCVREGSRFVYVFSLDAVYVPEGSRFVEIRHVELKKAVHADQSFGGTDGD